MSTKRKTAIIAIRVFPAGKKRLSKEAQKRQKTLTEFVRELIVAGWQIIVEQNDNESVKQ